MPDAGIHHLRKRKTIQRVQGREKQQKQANDPGLENFKKGMDKFIYIICIAAPLFAAPQAWKIWTQHNAGGISLITYTGFMFINVVWVVYGFLHKEKPVILLYCSLFVVNSIITLGRILYG